MAARNKPNELYITRIYDAPVKLVWDAWTDPKKAAVWWGPRGFTLTTHSKELRVGGQWRYTMHGPDGTDYPNIATYHEVEMGKRLVYDHGATETTPPLFRVTVTFEEIKGNKTKMDMTMALESPEKAVEIGKFIKQANGNSTWDRLAEYLGEKTEQKDLFVINRSFKTDIKTMFQMWTDPNHFSKWLGPTGSEMDFIKADIKPGGTSFYKMWSKDGPVMYGLVHYLEINPVHHLKYTQQFCDKDQKISRHPMAPTWPETMLTNVFLSEEGPDQTRVTVRWEVYGDATQAERDTFHGAKSGMMMGWGGSFEKLEEYISRGKA